MEWTRHHPAKTFEAAFSTLDSRLHETLALSKQIFKDTIASIDSNCPKSTTVAIVAIDRLAREAKEMSSFLLVRRQPVATDLRHIVAAGTIASELCHIAHCNAHIVECLGDTGAVQSNTAMSYFSGKLQSALATLERMFAARIQEDSAQLKSLVDDSGAFDEDVKSFSEGIRFRMLEQYMVFLVREMTIQKHTMGRFVKPSAKFAALTTQAALMAGFVPVVERDLTVISCHIRQIGSELHYVVTGDHLSD